MCDCLCRHYHNGIVGCNNDSPSGDPDTCSIVVVVVTGVDNNYIHILLFSVTTRMVKQRKREREREREREEGERERGRGRGRGREKERERERELSYDHYFS